MVISNYFDSYKFNNPISDDHSFDWNDFKKIKGKKIKNVIYTTQNQNLTNYKNFFTHLSNIKKKYFQHFKVKLGFFDSVLLAAYWSHWNTIKQFKKFDFIVFSSGGILLAPFCCRPYSIFPTGNDSTELPFRKSFEGKVYNLAYKKANIITPGTSNPNNYQFKTLKKLNILNKKVIPQKLLYCKDDYDLKENNEHKLPIFFSSCRHDWIEKKNNFVIKALTKFKNKNFLFYFIDYGKDVRKSKNLIGQLGLSHKIKFLPICSKKKIREIISNADLIFEQLGINGYSTGAFESMFLNKPVIMRYEKKITNKNYDFAPIINAQSINDLEMIIHDFFCNKLKYKKLGIKGRSWMLNYRSGYKNSEIYVKNLYINSF